jgi:hypothetical protein
MMQANCRFFSTIDRVGRNACVAFLILLGSGCAITPPKVDPYSTLLPAGTKVVDSMASFSAASLKRETAYLVVGANFVTYADVWNKFQKSAEEGGNLVYSKAFLLEIQAQWSPTRTTALVATDLQKHFRKIIVVNDLAEARAQGAKWIVMFDHAYVQTSTATATWTNSTTIDLLDSNFRRVVAAAFSEHKDYGAAWGDGDVQRFSKYRGEDVLHSVKAALILFDTKLASSTSKGAAKAWGYPVASLE